MHRTAGENGPGDPVSRARAITTSPASISPATEGTQATLPGTLLRPGGGASFCSGVRGSSGDQRTLWWTIPRLRSSLRTTRASGHPWVSARSPIRNWPGSSLLPVPRAEITEIPRSTALSIKSSLQDTRSMQSTR